MISSFQLAKSGVQGNRGSLAGTFLVLGLAGTLVSSVGVLTESGLRTQDDGASSDLLLAVASSFAGTAMVIVVMVVASTIGLSMRRRQRDFAVLRAVGATGEQVRRIVAGEALLLAAIAAPLGALPGLFAARRLVPLLVSSGVVAADFSLTISPLPILASVLILAPVAVVAARLSTRETLRMPPTLAITRTAAEKPSIGRIRQWLAIGTAVVGMLASLSPLVVPGALGSASAAISTLLLIGAAALGGPALIAWALDKLNQTVRSPGPAAFLALANSRGYPRRITAAIIPLAVALAIGTVQTSTNQVLQAATEKQLRDGLGDSLVVSANEISPSLVADTKNTPGVSSVVALASVLIKVRTDDEEFPGFSGLSWEPFSVRIVPSDVDVTGYDPDVIAGSMEDLSGPNTIALSTDARFETRHGLGDEVEIRFATGVTKTAVVVAVYRRGLGFGSYMVGEATAREARLDLVIDTVVITTSDPNSLMSLVQHAGLRGMDAIEYAKITASGSAEQQRLSAVLLLALLTFALLAAANTLVMVMSGRRDELKLLNQMGATRKQLAAMVTVEALIVALASWLIGTVVVLPATIAVSLSLLGLRVPMVAWSTFTILSVIVLVVPFLTLLPTTIKLMASSR